MHLDGLLKIAGLMFSCVSVGVAVASPTVNDFDGRLPLGQYAHYSVVDADLITDILNSDSTEYAAALAAEVEEYGYLDSPSNLNWQRNDVDAVHLDSPTQLTAIAIDLVNESASTEFMLEISNAHAVAWYYEDHHGQIHAHNDDFAAARIGRPIFDVKPVIPLELEQGHHYKIFIYIYYIPQLGKVSLDLWQPEAFRGERTKQFLIEGVYLGLAIAIAVGSLLLAIALRQIIYFYFAGVVICSAILMYNAAGLTTLYGLGDRIEFAFPLFFLSFGLTGLFSGLFSIKLLDMWNTNRKIFWCYVIFAGYNVCSTTFIVLTTADLGVSLEMINLIYGLGVLGFVSSQIGHLWAFFYYLRRNPITVLWFIGINTYSWALIVWSLAQSDSTYIGLEYRYTAQFAIFVDALLLLGILIYGYRQEHEIRLEAQEDAMKNMRLARDLEKSRSAFVGMVGHDLRGPVQAIRHFSQSLKNSASETTTNVLGKIDDNVEMISELLDNMVRISRLDWQSEAPVKEYVALRSVMNELRSEFTGKTSARDLRLEFSVADIGVLADRACLGQILRNLVENSIKYTEEGFIRLRTDIRGDRVFLYVEDSGVGIPSEDLRDVFKEFYRVDDNEDMAPGVGLGLSIVARLARLMDIKLEVVSNPGNGTEFSLQMPLAEAPEVVVPLRAEPVSTSARVVVAATNLEPFQKFLNLLENWGADIVTPASPQEIGESDLVLADLESYRTIDWHEDVPTLVLRGEESEADEGLLADGHKFIDQSISPMRLRSMVQRHLQLSVV